jgi:hypothetical protein
MTAPRGANGAVPQLSDQLAARAVALAIDPEVTPQDLAATLSRLAGGSRHVLEKARRRITHRDPHGRSQANVRATIALRLALNQYRDEERGSEGEGGKGQRTG